MTSCEVIIVILMDINHMIQFSESTYIKSSHKSINLTNHTTLEKSPEENAITTHTEHHHSKDFPIFEEGIPDNQGISNWLPTHVE